MGSKQLNREEYTLEHYRKEMETIPFNKEKFLQLTQERRQLEEKIGVAKDKSKTMNLFTFNYRKPTENFDTSKIYGKVLSLFTVKEEYRSYMYAIEKIIGGR